MTTKTRNGRPPAKQSQVERDAFISETKKCEQDGRDAYLLGKPREVPEGLAPFSHRYFWKAGYDDEALKDEQLSITY